MSRLRETVRISQKLCCQHRNTDVAHITLRTPARNRTSSSRSPPVGNRLGTRPLSNSVRQQIIGLQSQKSEGATFDPLNPQIDTDELGLPLEPISLPPEIFNPPPTRISSAQLQRLHRMASIAPPTAGSEEELEMLRDLEGLLGLMDQVKSVKLDADLVECTPGSERKADEAYMKVKRKDAIRKLLISGNYADPSDIFDGSRIDEAPLAQDDVPGHEPVIGKGLLAWRAEPMEK
ncbi:hypothetical protein NliqN6_4625 [Naganishia liquefaciens]|uniref:Uncharacterized protein n=1 Tax=Naganishia liquefaciens TaxID=104408 RepID=A0A8H3YGF1_9TREE|nr:hypothetical protein NliqN6_4625 [Naganishia liquefaciens]